MYSSASAYSHSSYSSSPPSSPGYIDSSSPASSPADGPDIYDDHNIPPLLLTRHPFSAATHNWRPPQYEKKRPVSPITPPSTVKKPRYNKPFEASIWDQLSPTNRAFKPRAVPPKPTQEQLEAEIWQKASEQMVDEGNGRVSLEGRNLTHIPESFIDDLSSFYTSSERSELDYVNPASRLHAAPPVTRPLNRASTEPAGAEIWGRPMLRTQSVATVPLGLPKHKIQLFLSSNQLSVIPLSLFRSDNLEHLTVLSLQIVLLKSLEELTICQNPICHLPAEILQMDLKSLHLFPNRHFLNPPPSSDPHDLGSSTVSRRELPLGSAKRRQISKTKKLYGIPSLLELSLRVLCSSADPDAAGSETVLETYYELPLPELPENSAMYSAERISHKIHFPQSLPPLTRKTLDACLPGSVYLDEDPDTPTAASRYDADSTGTGLCPSPKHQRLGTPRLFVQHAEERFTWETMVAGVDVGGAVPVRWRGCQRGCLDFLDPPEVIAPAPPTFNSPSRSSRDEDHDMADVVQMVQLGQGMTGAGSEDFGDE
ncbi:hypothetical protein DXG01_008359 [Tephrocybe rancida]|nr:hypothetical protein DXG01_008359 [Tephrocybe rancida]